MILDGHNRYEICKKNKIQFEIRHEELKDMKEARIWVIQNQLGRRNLTDYQRGKLSLQLKTMIQEKAKDKQKEGGKEKVSQKSVEPPIDTPKELAKLAGVSHDTIHKVEVIEKEAGPEVKEAVEKGEISINRAYKETRKKMTRLSEKDKISKVHHSIKFEILMNAWGNAENSQRKLFLRHILLASRDQIRRYINKHETEFLESDRRYYSDIDERCFEIILQFGFYYNDYLKRMIHKK